MLRFKERYNKEVVQKMVEKFGYKSVMAVPRVVKVAVNTGFGKQTVGLTPEEQRKVQQATLEDLGLICGQRPALTFSKQSIASFKLRKGQAIGAKVTLRAGKMEDFLDRLIRITIPRSRDFRGLEQKSLDKKGNLTIGIKEQITFSEITPESAKRIFGLEITVVTNAKTREEGLELLRLLGFPIKV